MEFAVLGIALLVWPFLAMWRAYAVIVLWGWFVYPVTNIPAPSIYFTVGMLMTLAMIVTPFRNKERKEEGNPVVNYLSNVFAYGLCIPAFALGFGWVWKWLQWGIA